jgi:hypothetical protein
VDKWITPQKEQRKKRSEVVHSKNLLIHDTYPQLVSQNTRLYLSYAHLFSVLWITPVENKTSRCYQISCGQNVNNSRVIPKNTQHT